MYRSNSECARLSASSTSFFVVTLAMLTLTACGGGGDNSPPPSPPNSSPASNTAPTVNAGPDQTIQLPTNSVELQGGATDPDNDSLSFSWTASPSEGVSFVDASAATTQVTFANASTYTLTLTVSDGQANAADTVQITVTPAGEVSEVWPGVDVESDPNILGVAIDEQRVALGDTVQSRYPGFGQDAADPTPPDTNWLSQITIQQLATHIAGFAKPGDSAVDLVFAPGTTWAYSDGGLNWLADALTNVFQRDLNDVLTEQVWSSLNMTTDDVQWRVPGASTPRPPVGSIQMREFASGMAVNPNAMARVGLLFLRKGVWRDQRIVSEEFVQMVSTPRTETAAATLADPTGFPDESLRSSRTT